MSKKHAGRRTEFSQWRGVMARLDNTLAKEAAANKETEKKEKKK